MSAEISPSDVPALVDRLLSTALERRASDLHLEPTANGYEARLRVDGMLSLAQRHGTAEGRAMVGRLMVLAHLLTYRQDVPQEGRMAWCALGQTRAIELRLAIMPTTHGLRAAVRMPAELLGPRTLEELGLPPGVLAGLQQFAATDAGMLLLTGPAGSGKTTTIYALLDHIVRRSPGLSIVALEDPVERDLPGVTQIEVSPFGQLTYERSLRSILRQDPQVLMLGEIRDRETAALAIQAALSGHRLVSALHAGTPAGAIARLLEMGLEPYQITSALHGVVAQRLLRRRLDGQYHGRVVAAEFARIDPALRSAILSRADAAQMTGCLTLQPGYTTMQQVAAELAAHGQTDAAEIERVFGAEARDRR
jgi:general secretion pathway protein E